MAKPNIDWAVIKVIAAKSHPGGCGIVTAGTESNKAIMRSSMALFPDTYCLAWDTKGGEHLEQYPGLSIFKIALSALTFSSSSGPTYVRYPPRVVEQLG